MTVISSKKLTGWHFFAILGGFFGIMIAVNIVFVYFAFTSFSGLSVEDPYLKGLNYNRELRAKRNQDELGWNSEIQFVSSVSQQGRLIVTVSGKNDVELPDLDIVARIINPVDGNSDFVVAMEKKQSRYEADIKFSRAGQWDVRITVKHPSLSSPYRIDKRIQVKS